MDGHGLLHMSEIACRVVQGYVQLPTARPRWRATSPRSSSGTSPSASASFPGVTSSRSTSGPIRSRTSRPRCSGSSAGSRPEIEATLLRGLSTERLGRPVGPRGLLRPLPARGRRRREGQGRRVRQLRRRSSRGRPTAGDNLKLSLNAKLEQVGQQALQESIDTNYPANGGAFVAMNPQRRDLRDGLAPTYNANVFTKPVPTAIQLAVRSQLGRSAGQPGLPERRADRIDVQADHRDRGARERAWSHRRHLRRHRSVLTPAASAGTTRATRSTARSTSRARSRSPPTTSSTTWAC